MKMVAFDKIKMIWENWEIEICLEDNDLSSILWYFDCIVEIDFRLSNLYLSMSEEASDSSRLAIIVPIYSYDPKSLQLVKQEWNEELSTFIKPLEIRNGKLLLEDAQPSSSNFTPREDWNQQYDSIPNVIANAQSLVSIFTALYENRAFSKVIEFVISW